MPLEQSNQNEDLRQPPAESSALLTSSNTRLKTMKDSDKWSRIESLFYDAVGLDAVQREEFLQKVAAEDSEIARELTKLLAADAGPHRLLDHPTVGEEIRQGNKVEDTKPEGLLSAGSIVGKYTIVSMIGRGGMGEVYLARDPGLARAVAIKVIKPRFSTNQERLRRFEREAFAISGVNHPNIITIHEIGEFEGLHYLVTEFIKGSTLRHYARQTVLTYESIFELVMQVAKALSAAHAEGVIHRDIKPENIMVRPDGVVKVLDFGLAKLDVPRRPDEIGQPLNDHETDTAPGMVVGTPTYMSPEQAAGRMVDARSDLFSLGTITYELLAGNPPFQGYTSPEIIEAVRKCNPVPIGEVVPGLPAHLCDVVSRMLCPRLEDRFQSAEELFETLRYGQKQARPRRDPNSDLQEANIAKADLVPTFVVDSLVVGREEEQANLRSYLNSVIAGHKRFVCITGEAGIGKTTVVENFLEGLNQTSQIFTIGRGWCSERLDGTGAYLPFLEVLESLVRGPNSASIVECMRRHAPTWYSQILPQPPLDNSIAGRRAGSQEQMKRELSAFLRQASKEKALILFIDDLHWADVSTVDLLSFLGSNRDSMRVLVVATYRVSEMLQVDHPFLRVMPDLQARGMCQEIPLRFLNVQEVARYIEQKFSNNTFTTEFPSLIHSRTEGNPLFVVEVLRYLRDHGVIARFEGRWILAQSMPLIEKQLPPSVSGMIQRKIDRLSDDDRHMLRIASVQGCEFDSAVVAESSGREIESVEEQLEKLERVHTFVRLTGEHQFPDKTFTSRYRFVHSLYQNVLYDSLRPARRASLSGRIGDGLLERYRGIGAPVASTLAILFESARHFDKSSQYYLLAAQGAAKMFAYREAIALSRRGLDVVKRMAVSPEQRLQEMGLQVSMGLALMAVQGHAATEVAQTFNRALELSAEVKEGPELVPLLRGLIFFYNQNLELDKALSLGEQLLRIANAEQDSGVTVEALFSRSLSFYFKGEFSSALRDAETATSLAGVGLEASRRIPKSAVVGSRVVAASSLWVLGYPVQATARMEEAVKFAQQLAHPFSLSFAYSWAAMLQLHLSEWSSAQELAEAARAIARERSFPLWLSNAYLYGGFAMVNQGKIDEGIALMRQALQTEKDSGAEIGRPYSLALYALSVGIRGDTDEALDLIDDAIKLAERVPGHMALAEVFRLKGELLHLDCIRRDQLTLDDAIGCFRKAVAISRKQNARSLELRAHISLCRIPTESFSGTERWDELTGCVDTFTEGENTADVRSARSLLGQHLEQT